MDPAIKLLLDGASRLFSEHCSQESLDAAEQGQWQSELWHAVEDNGLPNAACSERSGGIDLPMDAVMRVLRVQGAYAAPVPLAETLIGSFALDHCGLEVPPGPLALGTGNIERCSQGTLSGNLHLAGAITDSPTWQAVVESQDHSGSRWLGLIEVNESSGSRNIAGEQQAVVSLRGLQPSREMEAPPTLIPLQQLGAVARASQMAGAMDRVLDLTIEHAIGRQQFGRPISKFQAVQHHLAQLAAATAAVGVAAEAASATLLSQDPDRIELAVASAKTEASRSVRTVNKIAHQVHAAIGFTHEHVLHHFTRRLWAWRDDMGSETFWATVAGEHALRAGEDGLWPLLAGH